MNVGVVGSGTPVIVLSAGPNGQIETAFHLSVFIVGGDDIMGLLGTQR